MLVLAVLFAPLAVEVEVMYMLKRGERKLGEFLVDFSDMEG